MSDRVRRRLAGAAAVGAIGVLIVLGWTQRERIMAARVGDEAPGYAAPSLAGDTISLASLEGRVVLLNVWATWCGPCRWEMPALENLYNEFRDRGLVVLAVSVDGSSGGVEGFGRVNEEVRAFVNEYGLSFPILRDPEGRVQEIFGVTGLPTTFLIDRDGRIRERVLGPAHWDDAAHMQRVARLLES